MDVREKVGEFRRKIRLEALDGRGFYKSTEFLKTQNEKLISKMREGNKQTRIMLANSINGDEEIIKSVFIKRKEERLSMKKCTAVKAISIMDQKASEGRKHLNALKHESVQKREQIEKLQTTFRQLKLDDTRDCEFQIEQDIRCLQNDLDKAGIKCDIANDITRRYNQIKIYLEEECIMYPSRLDVLEAQRRDARKDLDVLPKINEDAVNHNEDAQKLFMDMKRQLFELRRSQEEVRNQSKKEVERLQQQDSDRTDKRMKLTHETDTSDNKAQNLLQEKGDHQEKILKLDGAFEKIKSAIRVSTYSTIDDVVYHVINQDNTRQRLVHRKEQGTRDKERLLEEKETLQAILDELKFKSQFKIAKDRKLVDAVEEFLKEEEDRRNVSLEQMTINEALLLDLTCGIATLFDKLKDVKLKPPYHNFPREDPIEDLTTCERKLEVLSSDIRAEQKSSEIEPVQVDQEKFNSYLEGNIQPSNFRVRLDVDGDSDTEEVLCEDNENYLSWELAKRQSIDLINYLLKQKMKKDGRV